MFTLSHKVHLVPCACTGDAKCHGSPTPDVRVEALREKRHDMGTLLRRPAIKGRERIQGRWEGVFSVMK